MRVLLDARRAGWRCRPGRAARRAARWACLLATCRVWRRSTSPIWRADGEQRVERRHRILEDHRDLLAADPLRSVRVGAVTSDSPFQRTSPPVIRPGSSIRPEQRLRGDALARARSRRRRRASRRGRREAHAADGLHHAAAGEELDVSARPRAAVVAAAQVGRRASVQSVSLGGHAPGLRCRCAAGGEALLALVRVGGDAQPAAEQVDGEHGEAISRARVDDQPPVAEQFVVAGAGDVEAPGRRPGTGCRGRGRTAPPRRG